MQKSTIISIVISLAMVGGAFYIVSDRSPSTTGNVIAPTKNVEVREGIQYVTIIAKGGYSPRTTEIAGGMPTKLVMKTSGTFDCSASLIIRSVGFQKVLPSTGEEVIDLGTPQSGDKVQGVCGMGMYSFQITVR